MVKEIILHSGVPRGSPCLSLNVSNFDWAEVRGTEVSELNHYFQASFILLFNGAL